MTDAVTSLPGTPYSVRLWRLHPHPRGWVRRAGNAPPCAASFFPYSFFAGEERIWPPEGASPLAWKKLDGERLPAPKKATKPQPQCVSNSEAASGLLTSPQGTDALANLSGSCGNVKKCAVGKHPKSEKHGNTAQFSEVERSGTQENCGGIGSGCRLRLRPLPVLRRRQSQRVARIDPNAVVVDKNIAENDRFDLFSR